MLKVQTKKQLESLHSDPKQQLMSSLPKEDLTHSKLSKSKNYLFIVTYKEMILGPPKEFWNEFIKGNIENFDENLLPPENVFIMSITDFEEIIDLHHQGILHIKDFLERAIDNNKNSSTSKLLVNMHLTNEEKEKVQLKYLRDITNEFLESIIEKIKPNSK